MGLITAAVVVGAAAVGSAAISSKAASKARKAQTGAATDAIGLERESRDLQLAYQKPGREAGYAATAALMDMTGLSRKPRSAIDMSRGSDGSWSATGADVPDLSSYDKYEYTTDPGYQFRLAEGNKAIEHSLVARGGALSGAAGKSALRYAQNYASNEYQNVYNRIATIAGFGANATNASTSAIGMAGRDMAQTTLNAGDARASSYVAQGNAWSGALNQIGAAAGYGMGGMGGGGFGSGGMGGGPMSNNYIPKYGAYA